MAASRGRMVESGTEQERSSLKLRAELKDCQDLFDTLHESFLVLSDDLRVLQANPAYYRTFRVTPEETEGRYLYELGNGQWHIPELRALFERVLPRKTSIEDYKVTHAFEGIGRRTMFLNARQINGGRTILLAIRDATERERIWEELKHSNRRLSEFVAVASHDLKEPLRTVMSYLMLMERQLGGDELRLRGFLRYARLGARRMEAFIDHLVSRGAIGAQPRYSEIELNEVLAGALEVLSSSIRETGAFVTYGPLPVIQGERTELVQLFQNLISNAIKFVGDRPPEVAVSARDEGDSWVVSVSDNGIGIGIPAEDQQHIFDMFVRLPEGARFPGSGIGLATCRRIAEGHGGRIWVESAGTGAGSTFHVSFPKSP